MGLCASSPNDVSEPKQVLKSKSINGSAGSSATSSGGSFLLKTNSELDIGAGAQTINPLNRHARTSIAMNISVDDDDDIASSENDDCTASSSSEDEEIIDDWLENGPSIEEMKQQEEIQREASKKKRDRNKAKKNRAKWSKFFEQFPREHQAELYNALSYETFYDGDKIVEQGKDGDTFYVITSGKAAITVTDEKTQVTRELTHLYIGDFFGETSIIYGSKRTATVSAVGTCECGVLKKHDFDRMTDVRHFLIMKKCDLIQQLSQAEQYEVLKHLIPVEFKKEQLLIKEGDIVQGEEYAFFMITKGEVRVFDKEHGTLVTLYEGHSIGEMALINDKPRNASVKAITKVVTCMALTKNAFKNCCSTNDDFNKKLNEISKRLEKVRQARKIQRSRKISAAKLTSSRNLNTPASFRLAANKMTSSRKLRTLSSPSAYQNSPSGGALNSPPSSGSLSPLSLVDQVIDETGDDSKNESVRKRNSSKAAVAAHVALATTKLVRKGRSQKDKKKFTTINNYVLVKDIGEGSFGKVKLVEDITNDRKQYAMKVIKRSANNHKKGGIQKYGGNDQDQELKNEIQAMSILKHHPNIVELVEVIDDSTCDDIYIVQELCSGEIMPDAEDLGGATPLDLSTARKYIRQMIRGIHYMHQCNIIHRDLKPQNILLSQDKKTIKICDFGTACFLSDTKSLIVPKGTPAFMAPEILVSETVSQSGPPSDVWSLGATLYMMTTGRQPFEADDYRALVNKVRNDELTFPRDVTLDAHLKNLIVRMLSKEVSRRPTLEEICRHDWITDEGTQPLEFHDDLQSGEQELGDYEEAKIEETDAFGDVEDWGDVVDDVDDFSSLDDEEEDDDVADNISSMCLQSRVGARSSFVPFNHESYLRMDSSFTMLYKQYNLHDIIYHERQGARDNMEDRVCLKEVTDGLFASVFDGHGGDAASQYLQTHFVDLLNLVLGYNIKSAKHNKAGDDLVLKCFKEASHIMDSILLSNAAKIIHRKSNSGIKSLTRTCKKAANEDNHLSGSTAAMVFFYQDKIYIGWVGDSRIIGEIKNKDDASSAVVELSTDHKAGRADEKTRIRQAGGTVNSKDRLYGDLAVSRAFGDIYHKGDVLKQDGKKHMKHLACMLDEHSNDFGEISIQNLDISSINFSPINDLQTGALVCTPDVVVEEKDKFKMIVIASDGIFDVMSNEAVIKFINDKLSLLKDAEGGYNSNSKTPSLMETIASDLTKHAETLGSVDNISVVIIMFKTS